MLPCSKRLWMSGLCAVLFLAPSAHAAVLRVKADAPGPARDGTTWATAFLKVSDALSGASPSDEVWVAAGTYVETISLKSGIALYGGFAGTETERAQRNSTAHVTILDGDKAGSVITARADVTQMAVVDGFTIRNGSGTFEGSGPLGGGFFGSGAAVTLANNVITGNYLEKGCSHCGPSGSAIYAGGGTYVIRGNRIEGNDSTYWLYGPAISISGTYTLIGNVIRGNGPGAAIQVADSGYIVGNLIQGNRSGIDVWGAVTIANNTIVGNSMGQMTASSGEAIQVHEGTATIVNNIIAFNDSGIQRASDQANVVLRSNNVFHNWFWDGTTWLIQDFQGLPDPTGQDGNISADPLFADRAEKDFHLSGESPCRDAGDDSVVQVGETDLDGNPRIQGPHVDIGAYEATPPVPFRAWRVKADAPGPAHDGQTWESAFLTVQAALNASGPGEEVWVASGTYSERITVAKTLGLYGGFAGTEAAGQERDPAQYITVLDGSAEGTVVAITSTATGAILDGFTIRNGMSEGAGGIDCTAPKAVLSNNTVTGNRSIHEEGAGGIRVAADGVKILDNIIADNVLEKRTLQPVYGGGIRYTGTNGEIARNKIIGNRCIGWAASGGGLYYSGARVSIHHNVISGNRAEGDASQDPVNLMSEVRGGGMDVRSDLVGIQYNVIADNTAYARSGFCQQDCSPAGLAWGGGVYVGRYGSRGTWLGVKSNLFVGNRADGNSESLGGGLYVFGIPTTIGNNTFSGNSLGAAKERTLGAALYGASDTDRDYIELSNSIVAFNDGATGPAITIDAYPVSPVSNNVFGNTPVNFRDKPGDPTGHSGNISVDPLFVDRASGNFRLQPGSPAINAGESAFISPDETDLDGGKRIISTAVDMGAYEAPLYAMLADAALALKAAGGLSSLAPADFTRLNAVPGSPEVDARDATHLARRAMGLDP